MEYLKKNIWIVSGLIIGAAGGYIYYVYVGCLSGTCPITSNPLSSTLYGALMGAVLFNMFAKEKPKKSEVEKMNDQV